MNHRTKYSQARRWVIKIGSALLTADGRGLDHDAIRGWVAQIAELRQQGIEVILVSSGSVAEGMSRMGWHKRPQALYELQAAAAVGQMGLVQVYEHAFREHELHTAQILLTHDDLSVRERYLNARSTLCTLLKMGVVPIINENDTVATDEIRFGDNDTLAGLTANLVEAGLLVLLTDQQGLYESDPRHDPEAKLIEEGCAGDVELERHAGEGGALGRGGMWTKLRAATLAARSGAATIIASGREPGSLARIAASETVGTLLLPMQAPIAARKQWLAGQLKVAGAVVLDDGAVQVLTEAGRSLLSVGVRDVRGRFKRGDLVSCVDPQGREIARGLVNYGDEETRLIMGQPSSRIAEILGYVDEPELIHRDNMVLLRD